MAVNTPQPPRLATLDGLRGILACVVIATHVPLMLGIHGYEPIGNACVLAFFTMSGFVLTRSYDHRYGVFLLRRFLRLWPVYLLSMAVGAAVLGRLPNIPALFFYIGYNADDINYVLAPNPPAWSLCIEAWMMPLMPLIAWLGRGSPWRAILILPAIAVCAKLDWHFSWAGCFMVGAWISPFTPRLGVLETRVPQWLGKVSYSLYMVHWPIMKALLLLAGPFGLIPGVALAPAAAWVVWRFVERPSVEWSRQAGRYAAARGSQKIVA